MRSFFDLIISQLVPKETTRLEHKETESSPSQDDSSQSDSGVLIRLPRRAVLAWPSVWASPMELGWQ